MGLYRQKINPRTGQFNLVPSNAVIAFKESVATAAALPLVGNNQNDARITDDTGHLYVWSGTAWIDQGDILDLNWSAISGKPSSAVIDIDDAVTKRHTKDTDLYLNTPVKNVLYVDGNRGDSYIANGSITKPFKKIQDAIDAVVAPSATNKFLIDIAPGAYYSDAIAINKIYLTFRSCGVQGARISGAITVTNPSSPTPEQITFVGLRISGGLTCLASHIAINCVDCNVTGADWVMNPTVPTDDEYLQVWGGMWYANATLTNVYSYLMGGGYYSTFTISGKEFNINNADINEPFEALLSGTVIGSAFGNRAGNSKFTLNAGANLHIDADTEGGSIITIAGGTLTRSTKGGNISNDSSVTGTTVKDALEALQAAIATGTVGAITIIPENGYLFPLTTTRAYYGHVLYSSTAMFHDGVSLRKYVAVYGNGTNNFVAYSDNGYTWNNEAQVTGVNNGYHSGVELVGTTLHLFYWDITVSIYSPAAIRHATIDTTVNCHIATTDAPLSGNFITGVSTDGLRYGTYGMDDIFYNASPTDNPANPYTYRWCAIHQGTDGSNEGILFATSSDGYNFSAWNGLNEVISRGTYPTWDAWIGNIETWMIGSKWYALYSGGVGTGHGADSNFADGLGLATSNDGITWTKDTNNPIMFKTMSYKTAKRLYCPCIVKEDDGFRLYYTAKSQAGAYRISKAIINYLK